MIRKFAAIPRCGFVLSAFLIGFLVAVGTVRAQQTPAQPPTADPSQPQQQPQTQQQPDQSSGSQEASPEDTIPGRRKKPRLYKKWTFNVGGGGSLLSGTTNTYVRGGGGVAEIGAARNYAEYFGLRGEFQFDNLPLRNSALQLAQAPGATSHAYAVMLGPVINIPATKNWGGFLLFGPAYVHRSGKLDSSTAVPGSACNGFYNWWGTCFNASLPLNVSTRSTDTCTARTAASQPPFVP